MSSPTFAWRITLRPTVLPVTESARDSISFGKAMPRGEFTANLDSISIHASGGFRP